MGWIANYPMRTVIGDPTMASVNSAVISTRDEPADDTDCIIGNEAKETERGYAYKHPSDDGRAIRFHHVKHVQSPYRQGREQCEACHE
jgi:hypothetical protein